MGERPYFLLYVLVCLEIGVFLVLVPWSAIWERNYFLEAVPALTPLVSSSWFRGAVAGLGVANIYMALREVVLRRRESCRLEEGPSGPPQTHPAHGRSSGRSSPEPWVATEE